jgi:transposase-like protein
MSQEVPEDKKTALAVVVAQGASVSAWARRNGVPSSTAYYWSNQPEVRRMVDALRRRSLDRAIGRMSRHAVAAADGIGKLAKEAESESVKLKAWRMLLSDQIAYTKYAGWEGRLAALEEKASAQSQGPKIQGGPGPFGVSP